MRHDAILFQNFYCPKRISFLIQSSLNFKYKFHKFLNFDLGKTSVCKNCIVKITHPMNQIWERTLGTSGNQCGRQGLGKVDWVRCTDSRFYSCLQHVRVHVYIESSSESWCLVYTIDFVPRENGDYHLEDRPTPNTWKQMFFLISWGDV